MSVTPLDFQDFIGTTADEQRWQICNAILEGGGGGGGDSDVAVGPDGVTRVPLNVNSAGELKVNVDASVDADLSQIENKLDTIIGIATPQAADVAVIKTKAQSIDNKLPTLVSGRLPVDGSGVTQPVSGAITSNNAANQTFNYTTTSTVTAGTVVIGPIDCSAFRCLSLHIISASTGNYAVQVSNNGTNWSNISGGALNAGGTATTQVGFIANTTGYGTNSVLYYALQGVQNVRVVVNTTLSGATNTIAVNLSQQPPVALNTSVQASGNPLQVTLTTTPAVTSGFNTYHTLISAASTNATSVKGGQGIIGTLILTNSSATWAYFKLVNKASAPTVGTDTAVINIGVAPNTTLDCSSSFAGLRMVTGIAYYVSAGSSLTDNTALAVAGTFLVNMTYA